MPRTLRARCVAGNGIRQEVSMHHIVTMLRLMTHINIGATIALAAWLVMHTDSAGSVSAIETAGTGAAAAVVEGAGR